LLMGVPPALAPVMLAVWLTVPSATVTVRLSVAIAKPDAFL
jgi:hypothetical protein